MGDSERMMNIGKTISDSVTRVHSLDPVGMQFGQGEDCEG